MLIDFRVTNYKSFRDAQELSLLPTSRRRMPDFEALPVVGVYGANAAGKSNLLDSLLLLKDIGRGMSDARGFKFHQPFLIDEDSEHRQASYEVDVAIDGILYQYALQIGPDRIEYEHLYSYGESNRRKILLVRDAKKVDFGSSVKNRSTLNLLAKELPQTTPALALAVSWKAETLQPFRTWLDSGLVRMPELGSMLEQGWDAAKAVERHPILTELVKEADLGIDDILLQEAPGPRQEYIEDFDEEAQEIEQRIQLATDTSSATALYRKLERVRFRRDRLIEPKRELAFYHNGSVRPFSFNMQSKGTRVFLRYLSTIVTVLERGATLVVDEFDNSLHPRLVPRIIELFKDKRSNPNDAQLILSTHDATLLGNAFGGPLLSRDEVWFVEKGSDGASEIFPLTAFRPREQHNIERGYLGGVYGAVPEVQPDSLVLTLLTANERSRERAEGDADTPTDETTEDR